MLYSGASTDTTFLLSMFGVLCNAVSFIKFRRIFNPISIMTTWWCGWLIISLSSFTGLYVPKEKTQGLVCLMILGYNIGCLLCKFNSSRRRADVPDRMYIDNAINKYLKIFLIFLLPFFLKSLTMFSSGQLSAEYRGQVFSQDGETSILYGNSYIELLYGFVIYSGILVMTIFTMNCSVVLGNNKNLLLASLLVVIKSIMTLGRYDVYRMAITYIIIFFCVGKKKELILIFEKIKDNFSITKKIISSILFLLLISIVFLISILRDESGLDIFSIIQNFFVSGNTMGFVLLSQSIESNDSYLNQNVSYGLSTFGILDTIITLVVRRFNQEYNGFSREVGMYQNTFVPTGSGDIGNAYYTMIFNFYLDAREIGVFFLPLILGWCITYFYHKFTATNDIYSLLYFTILITTALFSISQSLIGSSDFWGAIIWVYYLEKGYKKNGQVISKDSMAIH